MSAWRYFTCNRSHDSSASSARRAHVTLFTTLNYLSNRVASSPPTLPAGWAACSPQASSRMIWRMRLSSTSTPSTGIGTAPIRCVAVHKHSFRRLRVDQYMPSFSLVSGRRPGVFFEARDRRLEGSGACFSAREYIRVLLQARHLTGAGIERTSQRDSRFL